MRSIKTKEGLVMTTGHGNKNKADVEAAIGNLITELNQAYPSVEHKGKFCNRVRGSGYNAVVDDSTVYFIRGCAVGKRMVAFGTFSWAKLQFDGFNKRLERGTQLARSVCFYDDTDVLFIPSEVFERFLSDLEEWDETTHYWIFNLVDIMGHNGVLVTEGLRVFRDTPYATYTHTCSSIQPKPKSKQTVDGGDDGFDVTF